MKKWNIKFDKKSIESPQTSFVNIYKEEIRDTRITITNLFSQIRHDFISAKGKPFNKINKSRKDSSLIPKI
jgi:hypothetical protein